MRLDDITGEIREVALALLNAAGDSDHIRLHAITDSALEHGRFRANQGASRRVIASEFLALREAIGLGLRSNSWPDRLVEQTNEALIWDVRVARQAAERGLQLARKRPARR
jgi:hypothetical protein